MVMSAATVRSAVRKALAKIGNTNSHALPPNANNHDAVLHELYVASEIEAYAKKRREEALKAVRNHVVDVNDGVDEIDRVEPGTEQILLNGNHYTLTVKKANPAKRLNAAMVGNRLQTELGLSTGEQLKFMDACSTVSKPATTIRSIGN